MLPVLLYGAEIIPFTKTWIDKAEKAQNRLGMLLLKVNNRTVTSAIRAELGWFAIKELAQRPSENQVLGTITKPTRFQMGKGSTIYEPTPTESGARHHGWEEKGSIQTYPFAPNQIHTP